MRPVLGRCAFIYFMFLLFDKITIIWDAEITSVIAVFYG